jgi:Holliday junction resolvasome RuvABC endonuclease subunit
VVIIGIDPGTGISSPTGLACFDAATREIMIACNFTTKHKKLEHRLKDISDKVEVTLLDLSKHLKPSEPVLVVFESFVMMGKAGETLQRMIGSLMGRVPYRFKVTDVNNKRVKKVVAGTGSGTKIEVGRGVLEYFKEQAESRQVIERLLRHEQWDVIDAFAIGISGLYYAALQA